MKRVVLAAVMAAGLAGAQQVATLRIDVQGTATNASGISGGALVQATNVAEAVVEAAAPTLAVASAATVTGAQSNTIAAALQPSWAVTGTVQNAQRLVSADGSLIWTEIENGTNWQYCVTNAIGVEGDREKVIVTGWAMFEPGEYNGPPSNTVMSVTYKDDVGDGTWIYASGEWELMLREGFENTIVLSGWVGIPPLPAKITGGTPISDVTIDWYGPVTNRYQIATQTGTVILLTEHDEDPEAHPTLPRHSDVTNTVSAAIAAYPPIPTNAVSGWLLYDPGSNMWLRVSVSNWSFTVWEVVE